VRLSLPAYVYHLHAGLRRQVFHLLAQAGVRQIVLNQ